MKSAIAIIILLCAGVIPAAYGDTVYTWTDHDGTQRYSNAPPPEGVTQFKRIETPETPENTPGTGSKRRPGYDRMVEKSATEADRLEQQRKYREKAMQEKKRRMAESRRKSQIQSQRQKLEDTIATIKKRAVSPTYPQGMKEAQIREIQKQIKQLEATAQSSSK